MKNKFRNLIISFLCSLIFIGTAFPEETSCPSSKDCYNIFLNRIDKKEFEDAIKISNLLGEKFSESKEYARSTYLIGNSLRDVRLDESNLYLNKAKDLLPELGDYILYYLSENQLAKDNYQDAISLLNKLLINYTDTLWKNDTEYKLGDLYFNISDFPLCIKYLEKFINDLPNDERVIKAYKMIIVSYIKTEDIDKGLSLYREVWQRFPISDEVKDLEKFIVDSNISIPKPEPESIFQRGLTFSQASLYDEAIQEFNRYLSSLRESPSNKENHKFDAMTKIGISYYRLKKYDNAIDIFNKIIRQKPNGEIRLLSSLWLGKIYLKLDDEDNLIRTYNNLLKVYPDKKETVELLNYLAFYYKDHKLYGEAEKYYKIIIEYFPKDDLAESALWDLGWINYKFGKYDLSLEKFTQFSNTYRNSPLLPQVLYWKARSSDLMQKPEQSEKIVSRLCTEFIYSFYCYIARLRSGEEIKQDHPDIETGKEVIKEVESPETMLSDDIHYKKVKEFIAMRLDEDAINEIVPVITKFSHKKEILLALNKTLYDLGDYYHASQNIRSYLSEALLKGGDYSFNLWIQAYPQGFLSIIKRNLASEKIDPFLVAAVIREESGYNLKAVSGVGALGLMQLMPYTGKVVADELGMDFKKEMLFEQDENIKIGSWYLTDLLDKYKGNKVFAIAAYNAGPEAVDKWIEKNHSLEMDEFVESIPYKETRFFVKRVMRSLFEYKRIAGVPIIEDIFSGQKPPQ